MSKSTKALAVLLRTLTGHARRKGWSDAEWARRAALPKETLCRLRSRSSCDFATLEALAESVGTTLDVRHGASRTSVDRLWPATVDRALEARLIDLLAAGEIALEQWRLLGPPFFLAGLAVMLASVAGFNRKELLELAETLHPGASEPRVFARWLAQTPLSPSRFLPAVLAQVHRAP
jgi:hypothetical protein